MTTDELFSEAFPKPIIKPMNTAPQAVTTRYTQALIRDGVNDDFIIEHIACFDNLVDGHHCGFYFTAEIEARAAEKILSASGATPSAAVTRALTAHGVTFR